MKKAEDGERRERNISPAVKPVVSEVIADSSSGRCHNRAREHDRASLRLHLNFRPVLLLALCEIVIAGNEMLNKQITHPELLLSQSVKCKYHQAPSHIYNRL